MQKWRGVQEQRRKSMIETPVNGNRRTEETSKVFWEKDRAVFFFYIYTIDAFYYTENMIPL